MKFFLNKKHEYFLRELKRLNKICRYYNKMLIENYRHGKGKIKVPKIDLNEIKKLGFDSIEDYLNSYNKWPKIMEKKKDVDIYEYIKIMFIYWDIIKNELNISSNYPLSNVIFSPKINKLYTQLKKLYMKDSLLEEKRAIEKSDVQVKSYKNDILKLMELMKLNNLSPKEVVTIFSAEFYPEFVEYILTKKLEDGIIESKIKSDIKKLNPKI